MSKTAVQARPVSSTMKTRLKIQKPELTVLNLPQPEPQAASLGFLYKVLLVSAYCISALTLCLVFSV